MSATVEIHQLREGMFIHLDLGWWQHPFPLSSFMISSREQIATIRRLGLTRLRWSPELSRLDGPSGIDAADAGPQTESRTPVDAPSRHRAALAMQRAAEQRCLQQCVEATDAWKSAAAKVHSAPAETREITEGLSRSLVGKMMGDGEVCLRVLSDHHGERGSTHALNVSVISLLMGRVFGMSESEMLDIGVGALLHDIGKVELADRVRYPDPDFTHAQCALYREHVERGVALGAQMGLSEGAMQVLAQHHEMADGSGFPNRLNGDRMAAAARVVALVNRYDNLCNPVLPSHALTPHEALSLIFAQSRSKFDASMLSSFIRMMGVYPPGSLVQLTDDRYATVVSVNSSRPLKPSVLVCDPTVAVEDALLLNLDAEPDLGIRRSVRANQLPAQAHAYLSPQVRVTYYFEPIAASRREAFEDAVA